MKFVVSYSFILLLFILYLYDVQFRFLPFNMQYVVGNLGVITAVYSVLIERRKFKAVFVSYILFPFAIIAWDAFTCSINGNYELILTKNSVGAVRALFGAQFLFIISHNIVRGDIGFHKLIVLAIFLQSLLCVVIKFSPSIYALVDSIQVFDTGNADVYDVENYKRFLGIGNAVFFGVLRTCTFGLISAVFLVNISERFFDKLLYIILFLFISLISFLVARTVLLIVAISLVLLFIYQRHLSFKSRFLILFFLLVFVFVCYEITIIFIPENVLAWGFGSLDRSESSGGSIDNVLEWLFNTSFSFKTILLGDARYVDMGGGYYMGVDIGLYRRIFYGGIIGLTLSLYYHYRTIISIYKIDRTKDCKMLCLSLFFCYLVILCKGDTSLIQYYVLYLVFYSNGIFYNSSKIAGRRNDQ